MLAATASPVLAEHLQQSIPLDNSDKGFVDASSFAHHGDLFYLAGGFNGTVDFNPNGAPHIYMSTCPTTDGCSFVAAYHPDMQIAWFDIFYGTGDAFDQRLVPRTGGSVYRADLAYVRALVDQRPDARGRPGWVLVVIERAHVPTPSRSFHPTFLRPGRRRAGG